MVVHEERFQLFEKLVAQVADAAEIVVALIVRLHAHEPVVAHHALVPVFLLAKNGPKQTTSHDASRERRFFHEHQDVQRVAIGSECRGHEAKVVRKGHAGRQRLLELKRAERWIERKLVPAAFRRLNHDMDLVVLGTPR